LKLLFAADVFGITPEFRQLCQEITQQYIGLNNSKTSAAQYQVMGPYEDHLIIFSDEQRAYQYFSQNVGLIQYAQRLEKQLNSLSESTIFIGFSVGGSALWQLSSELNNTQLAKAICIYSSQIRHHTNILPTVPITLILPVSEPHFCIDAMAVSLEMTQKVSIVKTQYLHGFMNALSGNYNAAASREYSVSIFS
jgi:dienelactone hydrolase